MKKATIFLAVSVLTFAMLTGCGCRNSKPAPTTMPTTMPAATTAPTTTPTTRNTEPSTNSTIPDGNGPVSTEGTGSTENTTSGNARSGGMVGGSSTAPGNGNGITGSITG